MGLFLAIGAVVDTSKDAVQQALTEFAGERQGHFRLLPEVAKDGPDGISLQQGAHTSLLYPANLDWDDCSQFLSQKLDTAVFSFHIHDGSLWMFRLYQKGREIARFNPIPDYWGELSKSERSSWRPDAKVVAAAVPNAKAAVLSKYLVEWDLDSEDEASPACPGDQYSTGDCWQLCDFLRQLGFAYPLEEVGDRTGYELSVPDPNLAQLMQPRSKPWWKFW